MLAGYGYSGHGNKGKYKEGKKVSIDDVEYDCDFIREDFIELVTKYPDIDEDEDLTRERLVNIMLRRKNLIEDEDVEECVEEDKISIGGLDVIKSCKEIISKIKSVRKANKKLNRKA